MCLYRELFSQLAATENLDAGSPAVREPFAPQRGLVNTGPIVKTIQLLQVHREVTHGVPGVVKTPFRYAPNQRHLTAFETDSDRTTGARGLAFAPAPAGFPTAT